ncbi:MAG: hypothetical protein MUC76_09670 [Spirochaetes bacterium]|jgi:hypothetical protein|nr:hypothetical protein [Spirochaetota bacterium]
MNIGGVSIILILGLVNMALLVFQLLSGLRVLRVPIVIHRRAGILLVVIAILHASLAFMAR